MSPHRLAASAALPPAIQATVRRMFEYYHEARDLVHSTPSALVCSYSNYAHKELLCITLALDKAWPHFLPLTQEILRHLFEEHQTEAETARHLNLSRRQVRNHLQRVFRRVARLTGVWTSPSRGKGTAGPTPRGTQRI